MKYICILGQETPIKHVQDKIGKDSFDPWENQKLKKKKISQEL